MLKNLLLSGLLMFSPLSAEDNVVNEPPVEDKITEEEKEDIWATIHEWLDDKDGNGQPDIIDMILSKELVGGITIGLLITVGIYIFSITYTFKKGKTFKESSKKFEDEKNALIESFKKEREELINRYDYETKKIVETLEQTKKIITEYDSNQIELNKVINDSVKEVNTLINGIDERMAPINEANKKVNKMIKNQQLIANNTPNMVAKGIAKQINEDTNND